MLPMFFEVKYNGIMIFVSNINIGAKIVVPLEMRPVQNWTLKLATLQRCNVVIVSP